jgi:hypothetical protein
MRHAYGNAHLHSDCDCHGNCHIHADCDGNCHIHANGDRDIYCNCNCNGDCDRYSHSHRTASAYTDATASSDTAATTVRPAGRSLIWELASEPREFPDSIVVTRPFIGWQIISQL